MKLAPWPFFDSKQIQISSKILQSGKVNTWTGPETRKFEEEFSTWCGTKYSLAISNGTLALMAVYSALDLKAEDEIITTPRTFIATSSSAMFLGAKIVFADVDLNSGNITADLVEPLITDKTKAITVVHIAGWPAQMDEICKLANKYNLFVIEDCSQAHGASINGKMVGSFGDISVWSFCQDKIISTAGEGGMITTSNKVLWQRIWSLRDHGKSYEKVFEKKDDNGFKWLHEEIGLNMRMTEIQSAIGRYQLKKLDQWRVKREKNVSIMVDFLKDLEILRIPLPNKEVQHAWYKLYGYLISEKLSNGWNRERILGEIDKQGYPALSGGCSEIYLEKCFEKYGMQPQRRLKNAKLLGETSLMFLVHPTISENEMSSYASAIRSILIKATI